MTDRELIHGCVKKDAKSQRMLFEQYAGTMLTVCRRYSYDRSEAEDMLQEAFIRVFSYIDQFKFQGSLEGWIRRITVNAALKVLQNRKTHFREIREDESEASATSVPDLYDLGAEDLLELISRLPDGYRIVFNLYAIEGYSHDEIGALLQIKAATSRSQLSKARRMLKEQIITFQKIGH